MTDAQIKLYSAVRMVFPNEDVRVSVANDLMYAGFLVEVTRHLGDRIYILRRIVDKELLWNKHERFAAERIRRQFEHYISDELLGKRLV